RGGETPAGISDSAPKRSSDARVCIESTTPTAKPDTAMSGAERRPSSYSWRTVSLNSYGGVKISRAALARKSETAPTAASRVMTALSWRSAITSVEAASEGPLGRLRGSRPSRGPLSSVLDFVFLHLAVEGGAVQAQNLRRLLLVPVRSLQRLHDRHLLDLGQRAVWRNDELGRRGAFRSQRFRQIVDLDFRALRYQHTAFDDVLDLAHVARPAVTDEHVIGRRRN